MTILNNLTTYSLLQTHHRKNDENVIQDWELYTQLISFMNEAVWVGDKDEKTIYLQKS
jgi:hypothetical protein